MIPLPQCPKTETVSICPTPKKTFVCLFLLGYGRPTLRLIKIFLNVKKHFRTWSFTMYAVKELNFHLQLTDKEKVEILEKAQYELNCAP